MTKPAKYNRRAIMVTAWADTRAMMSRHAYAPKQLREVFACCLSNAWIDAKQEAYWAARSAESIADEIADLENRDSLAWHGSTARLSELRSRYRAALEREDLENKRDLIDAAAGRIASVTFIKKDGSTRVMRVQPAAAKFHVVGDKACDTSKRAVETRKERHPNLYPAWDIDAQAFRSINLATVTRIAADGKTYHFNQAA